jgi:hypothetical protein
MNPTMFKAGGALTDGHTDIYIERQADREVLSHLRMMEYLLVIEPRQQGKTSLINHLMCCPRLRDFTFVYIDVTSPNRSTESSWYKTLCPRIVNQLRDSCHVISIPTCPKIALDGASFYIKYLR